MHASDRAYDAFNLEKLNLPRSLIPGIILNEIKHYKPLVDDRQAFAVEYGLKLQPRESLGPAQMQVRNINGLVEARDEKTGDCLYPQLQPFKDAPLKQLYWRLLPFHRQLALVMAMHLFATPIATAIINGGANIRFCASLASPSSIRCSFDLNFVAGMWFASTTIWAD